MSRKEPTEKLRTSVEILKDMNRKQGEGDRLYEAPVSDEQLVALKKELAEAQKRETLELETLQAGYSVPNLEDEVPNVPPRFIPKEEIYQLVDGEELGVASIDTGTLTRDRGDGNPPPVPTSKRPSQRYSEPVAPVDPNAIYSDINEVLKTVGMTDEVTEDQKEETVKLAKVVQALEDPRAAATGYEDVKNILAMDDDYRDKQKRIAEKQEEKPVDFGLSSFFSFIGAMLGLEDEKEREAGLAQVMKEFAFLNEEGMSQEDRIANVAKAEKNICGESPAAAREASIQGDVQSSRPQESQALSEASKKKVQEQVTKDREKFLKKAEEEQAISKKAIAVNVGKAATCIALSVAVPGFGVIMSAVFLYMTRNMGNDDTTEKDRLKQELEGARRQLGGEAAKYTRRAPRDPGANNEPQEGEGEREDHEKDNGPNHLTAAAAKVAEGARGQLQDEKDKLRVEERTLQGVDGGLHVDVVGQVDKEAVATKGPIVAPTLLDSSLPAVESEYADLLPGHRIDASLLEKNSNVALINDSDEKPEYAAIAQDERVDDPEYDIAGNEGGRMTASEFALQQQKNEGVDDESSSHVLFKEALSEFKKTAGDEEIYHNEKVQVAPDLKGSSKEGVVV